MVGLKDSLKSRFGKPSMASAHILFNIGSGSGFVLQNVNLGLFRVHHDRQEKRRLPERSRGRKSRALEVPPNTHCRSLSSGWVS